MSVYMEWGDKGCEHRPDKCTHGPDDGCMWCCMRCNLNAHLTNSVQVVAHLVVSDHHNTP
jgi:hypothetical protein